jgi:hypothetical protein
MGAWSSRVMCTIFSRIFDGWRATYPNGQPESLRWFSRILVLWEPLMLQDAAWEVCTLSLPPLPATTIPYSGARSSTLRYNSPWCLTTTRREPSLTVTWNLPAPSHTKTSSLTVWMCGSTQPDCFMTTLLQSSGSAKGPHLQWDLLPTSFASRLSTSGFTATCRDMTTSQDRQMQWLMIARGCGT